MHPIQVGTSVIYRRGWTSYRSYMALVEFVELSDSGEFVYTLDDGHWCYAGQIIGTEVGIEIAHT